MVHRLAAVSMIALTGLLTSGVCWWTARTLGPDDFTGIPIAAGIIGCWAGMFVGVVVARMVLSDPDKLRAAAWKAREQAAAIDALTQEVKELRESLNKQRSDTKPPAESAITELDR